MIVGMILAAYVGSYFIWSRWAMRQAVEWDAAGYYFFPPENSARWETMNFTTVRIYSPLIAIDRWLGADMGPGYAPLWSVSGGQPAAAPAMPTDADSEAQDP